MESRIERHFCSSGEIACEIYYYRHQMHRIDGPAYTSYYKSAKIEIQVYYIKDVRHRLDGPAYLRRFESGEIETEEYIVNGIFLKTFEKYYSIKEKIFEYIQKYPKYIKEVELLARHNNWLNEKELELLACMDMFK
jgi:hypothetical protein